MKTRLALGSACRIVWLAWLLVPWTAFAEGDDVEVRLGRGAVPATIEAIDEARESVDAVVYKFSEDSLLLAVGRAVKRGVRVRLVVDESEAKDRKSQVSLAELSGVKVRRYQARDGKLHAKFVVVDGKRVLTGSYNWSRSAARGNLELLVSLRAPDTVNRFVAIFESLWKDAER